MLDVSKTHQSICPLYYDTGLTVPQHNVRGSYRLHWAVSVSVLAVVDAADLEHCMPIPGIFRAGVTLSCLNRVAVQHMVSLSQAQIERMSFPPHLVSA